MDVHIRPATADDLPTVQRVLYLAMTWDGGPEGITFERAMAHDYLAIYHENWGRPGDVGVVADTDGTPIGAAYGRLFTDDRHGHGFVDIATPEIAIAVEPTHVGAGIGTGLLGALEAAYRDGGTAQLSLSVSVANPAMRLYERLGYVEIDRDDNSARMVKQLSAP